MPSVVFVAPSAYTLSGLATWLDYLLPGLRAHGWDARLALVSGPRHHRPEKYLRTHPETRVHRVHCATGTPEGRARALGRLLSEAPADIMVSVNIPDLFEAVDRRRRNGLPAPRAVSSVHGIEAFLYADAKRHSGVLDAVVCTNRLACELAGRLGGIEPGRVYYAAYGVALPTRARVEKPRDRVHVVYSGRLESAQKRVGDLVPFVRALQARSLPFCLHVAGDGPERSALESALSRETSAGEVVFHGQLPIEELKSRLYATAHALLITSFWETGPIVAWEAMAEGLPVLSSRYIGSGLEGALVDGDNCRMFDIGDAEGAASALAELWSQRGLEARLADGGLRLLHERYLIPVSVSRWSDVLGQVLERAPRPAATDSRPLASAGRLDRLLGPRLGESLRSRLPLSRVRATDPGGEWPHSHAGARSDDEFWRLAQAVDLGADVTLPEPADVQ